MTLVSLEKISEWIDYDVSKSWGKKAACRIYHICQSGYDVEISDPFAKGNATEKPTKIACSVPGASIPAKTVYDVSQALSWIASNRNNVEERIAWQSDIPKLLEKL